MSKKAAIYQYLRQQQTLYGDELYLSVEPSLTSNKTDNGNPSSSELDLNAFYESICECQACPLGETRTKFVFGVGDANANLLLVGEAPGEHEDLKGEPFVGRAGKLLDKILTAIDCQREKGVYITNVLKCRPPNNRDPLPSEVEKCESILKEQIRLIQPKLIVALGRVAGKTLLKKDIPLKSMRGKTHDYAGVPLMVTYHPAALLRNPGLKTTAWEDFQWIRDFINNTS
jgi:DNA polymerase